MNHPSAAQMRMELYQYQYRENWIAMRKKESGRNYAGFWKKPRGKKGGNKPSQLTMDVCACLDGDTGTTAKEVAEHLGAKVQRISQTLWTLKNRGVARTEKTGDGHALLWYRGEDYTEIMAEWHRRGTADPDAPPPQRRPTKHVPPNRKPAPHTVAILKLLKRTPQVSKDIAKAIGCTERKTRKALWVLSCKGAAQKRSTGHAHHVEWVRGDYWQDTMDEWGIGDDHS